MIGFLTDWSVRSHYVGVAKAVMKRINPSVEIIDITHEIEPFNVRMASHILLRASKDFPAGSIFVAVVDYGVGTSRKAICMRTKNEQFFVGPDNGIFTHVALEYGVKQVRELNNKKYHYNSSYTFHGRDIFAPVAAHLSKGVPFEELGDVLPNFVVLPAKQAEIVNESIVAEIAYFDSFGNIQTNVPIQLAEKLDWQMDDVILINETFEATYVRAFGEVPKGALLIHPDSSGFLEIAINQGSAAEKLKLKPGQQVTLRRKKV